MGDHEIVNEIKKLEDTKMWISSLKLNSRPKVPKIAVVWNSLHTYLKENHDADFIMTDKQSATSNSSPDDDDDAYSPEELSDNDNGNNSGNNGNNEPSASSSNTSNSNVGSAPVEQNKEQEQRQGPQKIRQLAKLR